MREVFDIKTARKTDAGAIRACAQDAYGKYVAAIGRKPAPMMADFESLIASEFVYVATQGNSGVLGFVVFFQQDESIFLENVAVRSDASGRGIGKRLIGFCEAHAKRMGATSVKLYTNEKMTENLSIYPHLGYRETGRRTEDGFGRIYFEKRI